MNPVLKRKMIRNGVVRSGVIAVAIMLGMTSLARADAVMTADQLKELMTQEKYKDVVRESSRVLALQGKAAEGINRFEVMTIKGDALIHLKQLGDANSMFTVAAKEKTASDEQKDLATATALVVKRSKAEGFTPPPTADDPKPKPMDITTAENRAKVFPILYTEAHTAAEGKVKNLLGNWVMGQVAETIKAVASVQVLDRVVNHSTEETGRLMTSVSDEFAKRADAWAAASEASVKEIDTRAHEMVATDVGGVGGQGGRNNNGPRATERGLTTADRNKLNGILSECKQIVPVYKDVTAALGDKASSLSNVPSTVDRVYKAAEQVIKTRYDRVQY